MTDTEVSKTVPMMNPAELRNIGSFEEALELAREQWGGVADATTEIGDGFTMCDDKDELLNVPFVILGWFFAAGDFGDEYLIMRLVTKHGDKRIITDGSTGIAQQIREYQTRTGQQGGLMVPRGLRRSDYTYTDAEGKEKPAHTHYLNV